MSVGIVNCSSDLLHCSIAKDFTEDYTNFPQFQQALCGAIWGLQAPTKSNISPLIRYYLAQVSLIDPRELSIVKHNDVVEIIDFVRERIALTRLLIRGDLRASHPKWLGQSSTSADTAIDLAIRLWLLSDPTSFQADDCIIADQLKQQFPQAGNTAPFLEFELHFDAAFFENVAGVTIIGTQCLANHLLYDRKHKILTVFDVADFLGWDRDPKETNLFPPGLLNETQKSLALLFPQGRTDPNNLGLRRPRPDIEMSVLGQSADVHNPDRYIYWRDRLVALHSAYLKAQPGKLTQFWRDRRDLNQWTTLWLAILVIVLTLVFGLIQSITGILQVIIAYRQSSQP